MIIKTVWGEIGRYELHDEPEEYKKSGVVVDMLSEDKHLDKRKYWFFFQRSYRPEFFFLKTYRTVNGNCSQRGKICFFNTHFKID